MPRLPLDIVVSVVVLLTGGVNSSFSMLYTLPIIAASTVQSRRGGLLVGLLSSLSYGGVVLLQFFSEGLLPESLSVPLPPLRLALFTAGLKLRIPMEDHRWRPPLRLAFVSMTLTVAAVAAAGACRSVRR